MKRTSGEKIFGAVNATVLALIGLTCLYPFVYILSISLSTAAEASREGWHLYPRAISLTSYKMVLANPAIVSGFSNTLIRTLLGTVITIFATCLAAYPLARKEMPHRSMLTFIILFTMLFAGGMVPKYILIKKLGLINTVWALILPVMISAFNVIIVKNFFQALPESLAESAKMDGAGEFTILTRIYMPLSKPVLATVALWTAVMHWNSWFDALLYITDEKKQVLQVMLQRIVIESSTQLMEMGITDSSVVEFTAETIKAATIIVTILPIICVYPFLQKYFVKGVLLGGVKE